ncbi:hypothetical protein [Kordiimonas sp.]|uniref:hypothetical protein n=1 Tax=Kordiimonas sp. TaxID=1970157 RepID=UPI003A92EE64
MAVKLYLHTGYPKCGSTTIQEALHLNRVALRRRGYGVCGRDMQLMTARSSKRFPIGFFRRGFDAARERQTVDYRQAFKLLAEQAEKAKLKAVVLSAENLSARWAPAAIAGAGDYFDCRFISYFRRQDDWLISSWSQWQFKSGESLEAFLLRKTQTGQARIYQPVMEAYQSVFKHEQFRLRLLSRSHLVGGDLNSDFWDAIEVDPLGLEAAPSQNVSFSVPLATTLKESAYLFNDPHDNRLTAFIDEYHQHRAGRKPDPLGPARRRALLECYEEENRWIEAKFFPDGQLGHWRDIPEQDEDRARAIRQADQPSLQGMSEVLNINLAVLHSLRQDIDDIKKSLGLTT